MGFFYAQAKRTPAPRARIQISSETLAAQGCRACPRNKDLVPKFDPVGPEGAGVYLLSGAPAQGDYDAKKPFAGREWRRVWELLREAGVRPRGTNIVRCWAPAPLKSAREQEVGCCRGFAEDDIGFTAPGVVLGFGGEALEWATGLTNIVKWRGWAVPAYVQGHRFWYLPLMDPGFVKAKGSDYEALFDFDLRRALQLLNDGLPPVPYFPKEEHGKGVEVITGEGGRADFNRLLTVLGELEKEPAVGFDIETSGLRPYNRTSRIYSMSFGTFGKTVAFPLDDPRGWTDSWRGAVRQASLDFLLSSGRKICHNLAFEQEWVGHFFGREVLRRTEWEDTMAQAHTLDERRGTHSLGALTRVHFGFNLKDSSRVDPVRFLEFPLEDGLLYNGMDAKWTHLLFFHQLRLIDREQDAGLRWEYDRKVRLSPTLVRAQLYGVLPDLGRAEELRSQFQASVDRVERLLKKTPEVDEYVRRFGSFSPTSDQHVLKLFKDVLKRKEVEKAQGGFTTDEEALSRIPKDEALSASLILEHRAATKVISTYLLPVIERKIVHDDGLIHTNYNSMEAETGRLSSDDPNLQNFPTRKNKEVRSIIQAFDDEWIVPADYGQIEARVIAMASEDPNLVRYLWEGYDIHGAWARYIREEYPEVDQWLIDEFGIDSHDEKKLLKTLRQETKNKWVFPQFFGSSFRSCARNLHLPDDIAKSLSDRFWDEFSGVKKWQGRMVKFYERHQYVTTLTGRRRHGPLGLNQIINTPIQGTASDIVTEAMNALSVRSEEEDLPSLQARMNIHDDLTFYIPDALLQHHIYIIAHEMTKVRFDFINVPIIVEISMGKRWSEKEEIGVWSSEEEHNHHPTKKRRSR